MNSLTSRDFADAGFADQANQLGRTAAGEIEAVEHARELAVASDQRRAEAQRLKSARRPRCFKRPDQPMHQNAAGLAAQRDVAERFICERVPGQPMGERPDQHLARRAHRLQSLRSVHRVAGHRIGFAAAGAKSAGHDRSGVDADVKHQWRAGIGCRALAQARGPRDHVESRAQRPLGVVFMCNRRPEQGEQRIADEFVDETAPVLDRCRQLLEQLVLQGPHQFRVELLAQCGEAAEIGKQHGDGAAIGFGLGPGRLESAAASIAACADRLARRLLAGSTIGGDCCRLSALAAPST